MNNENERTAYIQQCGSISQTMLHKTSQTWRLYAVWCYFYKVYKQAKVISCSFEKEKQDCEYRSMRGASRVPYFMSSPGQWWAQMCSLHDVMCHLKCLCFLYDCAHTHTHSFQHLGKQKGKYLGLWLYKLQLWMEDPGGGGARERS